MALCETCTNKGRRTCEKNSVIKAAKKEIPEGMEDDPSMQNHLEFVRQNAERTGQKRGCTEPTVQI